ncbi:hypothetical protein DFJ73DRAFT_852803 [Zopfochytrium polystomum]|nr:hypothetical protein DFJ73DRAFT_852803 [Zopfochytrium polystomum]
MPGWERTAAALMGSSGVALAAFGSHGLRPRLADDPEVDKKVQNFQLAAHYQLMHAVALLAVSELGGESSLPGYLWVAGVAGFSGTLYTLSLLPSGIALRKRVAVFAPLGGLCLIAGWVAVAFVD